MPFLIGQCCVDQVVDGGSGSSSGDLSGKNEIIAFDATDPDNTDLIIPWNSTRKSRFGDAAVFQVEIYTPEENKYLQASVMAWPDSAVNTTQYTIRIAGPSSGRVIIS